MLTHKEKLDYIKQNIGFTRVKFIEGISDVDKTYRNVKVAMTKKKKQGIRTANITVKQVVEAFDNIFEIDDFEIQLRAAFEQRRQQIREQRKIEIDDELLELDRQIQKLREEKKDLE